LLERAVDIPRTNAFAHRLCSIPMSSQLISKSRYLIRKERRKVFPFAGIREPVIERGALCPRPTAGFDQDPAAPLQTPALAVLTHDRP
jgi:putative SOS response-associated peptidase YedK